MGEPIAVAFVEVLPETAAFKAATETQIRSQLAATQFAVPPAAGTQTVRALGTAATETATAEQLLVTATQEYNAALAAGEGLQTEAARAHVRKAAAAEADATAQQALFAITQDTSAAVVAEIDTLVAATGALNRKAIAEERAAFATASHSAASKEITEALSAESLSMIGLRGASVGVNPAFLAATAGAIALFKSVELAGDFEEQMHQIEFATHATGAELEAAAKKAEQFGSAQDIFQASSLDAITAIKEETESGQTLNEAYAETPAVLNLATAAEISHQDAVRTTIQLLDAYNLSADQATEVTDAIAIAGKSGAGSAEEFANSLRVAAPVANAFGLSIRDTTTLLIQMVQGGVSASQAGSLLRQALLRLTNPSKQAREALKSIGITDFKREFLDAQGNLRPDAFERLAVALDKVGAAQQRNVLTAIFSRRAVTGLLTITGEQRAAYEATARAAHQKGVAEEEAAEKSRGLKGQTAELKDDLSDLGTELGQVAVGPLTLFVKNLRGGVQAMKDVVDIGKGVAGTIGSIGSALESAGSHIPGGGFLGGLVKDFVKFKATHLIPGSEIEGPLRRIADAVRGTEQETKPELDAMASNFEHGMGRIADSVDDAADHVESGTRRLNLSGQLAVAQATGTQADQLRILREQQAKQQADLARKQQRFAAGTVNQAAVENAAAALETTNSAIAAILSDQKSKTEQAANDAKDKRDKIKAAAEARDQAFLDAINSAQVRKEALVTAASSTEAKADDIRANAALRDFLRTSIAQVLDRIAEARKAGRDTRGLKAELQTLRLAKAEVRREIQRLRKERREEAEQNRIESAQLDVELAGIGADAGSDNRSQASINKEIRARQRLIAALRKAQDHVKKGTLEWKRLRNEIAQEQAAIADLKKQNDKKHEDATSLQKQEFEFLQTIHGFSANLLGNLIPGTATAGLVGGRTGPPQPRTATTLGPTGATRQEAAAARTQPVTAGQGNTQIDLLRKIHHELIVARRGPDHPEAREQRRRGAAAGDYSYQGTHGM